MSAAKTFPAHLQDFFEQHLTVERNASPNTIVSYRDALKLFVRHVSRERGCPPDALDHGALEVEHVRSFLAFLERERGCGPRTRNQRLAALKSFARYVASVAPEHLERSRRLRELKPAAFERPEVSYLEADEVAHLIQAPEVHTVAGLRDRALLLFLYNTGARAQELVGLNVGQVRLDPTTVVVIRGKGRKQRTCPLWTKTADALRAWLSSRGAPGEAEPLFVNERGGRLSRSGVAYLLRRARGQAALGELKHARSLSPHVVRHTTAMHLLQAGCDMTTIAAWLGHAQLTTTHGYVEINLRMKQAALAAADTLPELSVGTYPAPDLVNWLEALGRRSIMRSPPALKAARSARTRSNSA